MSIMIKATTTCAVEGQARKATVSNRTEGKDRETRRDWVQIHGYTGEYIEGE